MQSYYASPEKIARLGQLQKGNTIELHVTVSPLEERIYKGTVARVGTPRDGGNGTTAHIVLSEGAHSTSLLFVLGDDDNDQPALPMWLLVM